MPSLRMYIEPWITPPVSLSNADLLLMAPGIPMSTVYARAYGLIPFSSVLSSPTVDVGKPFTVGVINHTITQAISYPLLTAVNIVPGDTMSEVNAGTTQRVAAVGGTIACRLAHVSAAGALIQMLWGDGAACVVPFQTVTTGAPQPLQGGLPNPYVIPAGDRLGYVISMIRGVFIVEPDAFSIRAGGTQEIDSLFAPQQTAHRIWVQTNTANTITFDIPATPTLGHRRRNMDGEIWNVIPEVADYL